MQTRQVTGFLLNNYKWSRQGQSARVFSKVPGDLLQRGAPGEWSDIRTAGKCELNGSAYRVKKGKQTKSLQKRLDKYKLKAQAAKMHATGLIALTNELNANLANWE